MVFPANLLGERHPGAVRTDSRPYGASTLGRNWYLAAAVQIQQPQALISAPARMKEQFQSVGGERRPGVDGRIAGKPLPFAAELSLVGSNRNPPDVHVQRLLREHHTALVGNAGLRPNAISQSDLQGFGGDISRGKNIGSPQIRAAAIGQGKEDATAFPVARRDAAFGAKHGVLAQGAAAAGALRLA